MSQDAKRSVAATKSELVPDPTGTFRPTRAQTLVLILTAGTVLTLGSLTAQQTEVLIMLIMLIM